MKESQHCANCRYVEYKSGQIFCHKMRDTVTDKQGRIYSTSRACPPDFGKTCRQWQFKA